MKSPTYGTSSKLSTAFSAGVVLSAGQKRVTFGMLGSRPVATKHAADDGVRLARRYFPRFPDFDLVAATFDLNDCTCWVALRVPGSIGTFYRFILLIRRVRNGDSVLSEHVEYLTSRHNGSSVSC